MRVSFRLTVCQFILVATLASLGGPAGASNPVESPPTADDGTQCHYIRRVRNWTQIDEVTILLRGTKGRYVVTFEEPCRQARLAQSLSISSTVQRCLRSGDKVSFQRFGRTLDTNGFYVDPSQANIYCHIRTVRMLAPTAPDPVKATSPVKPPEPVKAPEPRFRF